MMIVFAVLLLFLICFAKATRNTTPDHPDAPPKPAGAAAADDADDADDVDDAPTRWTTRAAAKHQKAE